MATKKITGTKATTSAPARKAKAPAKPKPTIKASRSATARTPRPRKDAASLPNRVRQLREKAGSSPKEFAASIGGEWTASTVRRIERGARKATPEQIAQLADALKVDVAALGFTAP